MATESKLRQFAENWTWVETLKVATGVGLVLMDALALNGSCPVEARWVVAANLGYLMLVAGI